MFISAKQIIGSRVVTQSNDYLGKVLDFDVNPEVKNQNIVRFYVRGEFLERLKEPLVIEINHVLEIKEGEIIVEDATLTKEVVPEIAPESGI